MFSFQGISGKSDHEVCPRKLFLCGQDQCLHILIEGIFNKPFYLHTNCSNKVFLSSFQKPWHYENVLKQWLRCERLSRAEVCAFFKNAVHVSICDDLLSWISCFAVIGNMIFYLLREKSDKILQTF